ncbi:hypothetical protein A3A84_03760 [Candidatus Collierbacteria bacterium RIFCSPLOWO2_01_FULL_50_23]|uniref:Toxin YoeB n=2 Tax=Candidatus Collieribacteriota TaxID=1752725 RepID=A0A1F5ETD2_9BACT|nr:MAG: hypothetical protein A3D09_01470 [Candidatus Collierbacteria bacterium RIFCSPHIGHO2_02_FULL_49_10]OGD71305.1 MAG: hypothetical protein A2703_03340 [Candidatus Collierbacteria bacterium RIFCSPHIGHO2_01_FULL_50_25]OGD75286.1 MAG: hypothetical protein A3A84_03760 [Candidatus Collierbacteria bacterium RIFCSPLOWO2_01_FULL_50_23]
MKRFLFSLKFVRKLRDIKHKNKDLGESIRKQLKLFKANPKHQSLRLHKLRGNLKDVWSISVNKSFRLLYTENAGSYYFFDLGFHSEIYER